MVKIRLTRLGKKKAAFYRIVVADSRIQRNGKYIENLGIYDPKTGKIQINQEIAIKWLAWGAQPTASVRSFLSKNGIMKAFADQQRNSSKTKKRGKPLKTKKITELPKTDVKIKKILETNKNQPNKEK